MAVLYDPAPKWEPPRSDSLVLWHGCTNFDREGIERFGIDLKFSRVDLDFGRGFYATTLERQAKHWAHRRYNSGRIPKHDNRPVLLRFCVPRLTLAKLMSLHFVSPDYDNSDYWSLVQHCRQSKSAKGKRIPLVNHHNGPVIEDGLGWYDIVYGPVVASWEQRVCLVGMDQISFHTMAGVSLLNRLISTGEKENYSWQPVV